MDDHTVGMRYVFTNVIKYLPRPKQVREISRHNDVGDTLVQPLQ